MTGQVFASRVDRLFVLIFAGEFLILLAVFAAIAALDPSPVALGSVALSAILVVVVPMWLSRTTTYTVTADELTVRCGPLVWHIPRASISGLRRRRDLGSAPALSFDRLEVAYGNGRRLMISPEDEGRFLNLIQRSTKGSR